MKCHGTMIIQPRYGAALDREACEDFGAGLMAGDGARRGPDKSGPDKNGLDR
jgi:hypothetical protein